MSRFDAALELIWFELTLEQQERYIGRCLRLMPSRAIVRALRMISDARLNNVQALLKREGADDA